MASEPAASTAEQDVAKGEPGSDSSKWIDANPSNSTLTSNLPPLAYSSYAESLIHSTDPLHPANLIPQLCAAFYTLGWVTGTGGGASIRHGKHIYIAPSGVQKEKIVSTDLFVLEFATRTYLRRPPQLKPSACTPLFLESFVRGAGCCIHTHSQWAVLVTLLVERDGRGTGDEKGKMFEIEEIEQIKGIPKGKGKPGNLGYYDRLRIPIIENTAQ
jgi:methylthioribulose-1-phosphate dehydratase